MAELQHYVLVPLMAYGHMIPMLDMAKLLLSRGLKTTILATPAFSEPIKRAQQSGHDIGLIVLKFPPEGSSLPDNVVSLDQAITPDLLENFLEALSLLQEPFERLLQDLNPNCVVSDLFFPWTTYSAAKFGIPRLVFSVTCCFALCAQEHMDLYKPYKKVSSDSEPFVLPNLPHELTFIRTQVPQFLLQESDDMFTDLRERMMESLGKSYGVIFNSFLELEAEYADHYKNVFGRKSWHIGPLYLWCGDEGKAQRGKESAIGEHECLAWLDSKRPNSVVYACFGSGVNFTPVQLHEIAVGLEASGQDFIWVVRNGKNKEGNEEWLPEGFEERIKGKGLIIRGWAPQTMILNHPAIGAFVTHCGWNSTIEGICAGLPLATWPYFSDHFYIEKLVTEVLRTGVSVCNKKWESVAIEGVSSETVTKAVQRIMVGEEALQIRGRAKCHKELARKAIEEGGSSYINLRALIEELSLHCPPTK